MATYACKRVATYACKRVATYACKRVATYACEQRVATYACERRQQNKLSIDLSEYELDRSSGRTRHKCLE